MSIYGISPAFYQVLMDPEARSSVLKEIRAKAVEKEFRNKLKDKKKYKGIILRLEMSRNVVGQSNGSDIIDERPIFYKAWIRIPEIHGELLPNPCDWPSPSEQQMLIGLHKPYAISTTIAPDMAAKYNLKAGKTVWCEYNPGPGKRGNQRDFTFDPATVGVADLKEYSCLERRTALIRGGFAKNPQLYFSEPKPDEPDIKKKQEQIKITEEKIAIGEKILFKHNEAVILQPSYAILTAVANILKANPKIKVRIDGHTDSTGTDTYNQILSDLRAKSVYNRLLLDEDVPARQLSSKGFGETSPVASNDTAAGRDKNRRVEFTILDKKQAGDYEEGDLYEETPLAPHQDL